jgi:hypothetical protein
MAYVYDIEPDLRAECLRDLQSPAYLYLIGSGKRGSATKIGITRSPIANRLKDLQANHWEELKVIYVTDFMYKYAARYEHTMKRWYATKNVRGEWYKLTEDDLVNIIDYIEGWWRPDYSPGLAEVEHREMSKHYKVQKQILTERIPAHIPKEKWNSYRSKRLRYLQKRQELIK